MKKIIEIPIYITYDSSKFLVKKELLNKERVQYLVHEINQGKTMPLLEVKKTDSGKYEVINDQDLAYAYQIMDENKEIHFYIDSAEHFCDRHKIVLCLDKHERKLFKQYKRKYDIRGYAKKRRFLWLRF